MAGEAGLCVPVLVPVASAVRGAPRSRLSPDEIQGLVVIISMLDPLADILDLGIDIGLGADASTSTAEDAGGTGAGDAAGAGGGGSVRSVPEGTEPEPVRTLFRADTREPKEIFSRGFRAKASNMDLWHHVHDDPDDSGFVSTSKTLSSAQDFAEDIGADYIYKVRASGYDVNAIFGVHSPFPWENEISVPGAISPDNIEGVWGPEGWVANPGFKP